MPQIIAKTQSVESRPDGVRVKVFVEAPIISPDFTKELRARGRALLSAGVLDTTVDAISDIPAGKIDRLTDVEDVDSLSGEPHPVLESKVYTVLVRKD